MISKILIVFIMVINVTYAGFYDKHAEGWHWYETITEDEKKTSEPSIAATLTAAEQVKSYRKEIDEKLNLAWLEPTERNIKNFLVMQQDLFNRSSNFAEIWQYVVLNNPELNYSLQFPTNQIGRHIYETEQREENKQLLKALSKTHGLFFFYKSNCPYCKEMAPIVKNFAQKHDWDIVAISLDGEVLPEFPNSRIDQGQAEYLGVTVVPALAAVDPREQNILPLALGLSSEGEIETNMRLLMNIQNYLKENKDVAK